jgi:hypothetical protein
MTEQIYKPVSKEQIESLTSRGCTAENWGTVKVADGFDALSIMGTHFIGDVKLGNLSGAINSIGGLEKPCGIYNATIANCCVGDKVRIANVAVHIANYNIADNVCIENVAVMQTNSGATFGNGVEVEVLNEAGGREVVLFDHLNAQFAYMMCLHRYRPNLIEKLKAIADGYVQSVKSDYGIVGRGVKICSTKEIIDVNIGQYATVNGASSLVNGSILSSEDAPTIVGVEVAAKNFIIAESSSVESGAILHGVFVGQGCQMGKQFSAENSLFFANSEGFHGEACSVFAGPYTVTHHKSTLLIAGLLSFYNAGSGTNQSNHMYKLGPVHEGKLQRGTKTGSFSYMMWPCRVGPFSVVLGKHSSTFDTANFPFSHLEARPDGKCNMVPGLHLTTVGTVRDGAKWPSRDRRKGSVKRDVISFDVFSPYTVGKMLKANAQLLKMQNDTEKSIEEVSVCGAMVKRPILRSSQKYYRTGIGIYLLGKIVDKAEQLIQDTTLKVSDAFAVESDSDFSAEWVDIGGQLMPQKRLADLEDAIENGSICTMEAFMEQIQKIHQDYQKDEWAWVRKMYEENFDIDLGSATKEQLSGIAREFLKIKSKFLKLVIADAAKEFAELSRCGYGQDGGIEDIAADFNETKGLYENNKFVIDMKQNVEQLESRIEKLEERISNY